MPIDLSQKPQFLLVNKPSGWTSHDVVGYVRNQIRRNAICGYSDNANFRIRATTGKIKVGHAGTLDPFATGLLIVGVGRDATKRLDEFKKLPKTYVATLKLGAVSDTYDRTGVILETWNSQLITHPPKKVTSCAFQDTNNKIPNTTTVQKVIEFFKGKQDQIPPMFSAKKIGGKKLYELARKGIEIERKPVEIEIFDIKILAYSWPTLKIEVRCSCGTYIRSLANDIGEKLGCGAYCEELERTAIGEHQLPTIHDTRNTIQIGIVS